MNTMNYFNYKRRSTSEVAVGNTPLGAENPIRVQSMANVSTMETADAVKQAISIIDAGAAYVRFTAQGVREAENLANIREGLNQKGYHTPLVADIHFNPKAADAAALVIEKVRINPGNYVDSIRTFEELTYTDAEYAAELDKIRTRFVPFLKSCKQHQTAIRIGVNHGSLSDRIMSRYGDTPEGMVASCMEFLRICHDEQFNNVVISIKASNTVVMVRTVRLLVDTMQKEAMHYPLHLGVTEAGDGEDGRIKSAVGIGTLLMDGLGDTIRVSLSEDPEAEIPVAKTLVRYITSQSKHPHIEAAFDARFDRLDPLRRESIKVDRIGGKRLPIVISDCRNGDFEFSPITMPDYLYIGDENPENLPDQFKLLVDAHYWTPRANAFPFFIASEAEEMAQCTASLKFIRLTYSDLTPATLSILTEEKQAVIILSTNHPYGVGEQRAAMHRLMLAGCRLPVVLHRTYSTQECSTLQIKSGADFGALFLDGFGDGIMIEAENIENQLVDSCMFGILQAVRLRLSKTEYISCPSCGRTLFDLQTAIARIKEATSHLKELKIGIMGCIVNGPGEMADADYGYVGAGRNQISLYKGKVCVQKNIPEAEAVERLIQLIKENGDWKD